MEGKDEVRVRGLPLSSFPRVTETPGINLATITGDTHSMPIGFFASRKSLITLNIYK